MGWLTPTVIIIGMIMTVVATIIIIKVNKMASKLEVTPNAPLIENLARTQFTEGYSHGLLKKSIPRKNGCIYLEFYPLDAEQGESKPHPEIQSLIVKQEMVKRFARGEYSSRREVIKLLGRSPVDYPEKIRKSIEGEWLTREGQLAHIENQFGKAIRSGDEAIADAMDLYARGEIPRKILANINELTAEMQSIAFKETAKKEEEK